MPKKLLTLLVGLVFSVFFFSSANLTHAQEGATCGGYGVCIKTPSCPRVSRTDVTGSCTDSSYSCCSPEEVSDPFQGLGGTTFNEVEEQLESVRLGEEEGLTSIGYTVKNFTSAFLPDIFTRLLPVKGSSYDTAYNPSSSVVGSLTGMIGSMYHHPPASSETYVADILNSAHAAPQAYAQGIGFSSLTPILETWKIFRNVAYFFFIIIFLAIGFMIMFRSKIGGQTAVTAQQAIPRVIVALLAVTFSYAIAGLLIDIMYIFMLLLIGIFDVPNIVNFSIFKMGAALVSGGFSAGNTAVSGFIEANINLGVLDPLTDTLLGGAGGILAGVIIAIAIVINMFRLFFELLKTYVSLIISIVMSPITLMLGAIPGKNNFGKWVKSIIGNLSAFPIVLIVLILFEKITGGLSGNLPPIENGGFSPPYLGGTPGSGVLSFLVGLGILLVITDLVKQGKKALGAGEGPFDALSGALADSIKRGFKGDELIPGLGFTNTANIPIVGSGKSFAKSAGVAIPSAVGMVVGGATGAAGAKLLRRPGMGGEWFKAGFRWGQPVADRIKHEQFFNKERDKRKPKKP